MLKNLEIYILSAAINYSINLFSTRSWWKKEVACKYIWSPQIILTADWNSAKTLMAYGIIQTM